MQDRNTTRDMKEGLELIYACWEAEMQSTLQQLQDMVTEPELREQISESQKAWERAVDSAMQTDNDLLGKDGWATELFVKLPDARIRHYRERTIHLKYLMYLYADCSSDCVALTFQPIEEPNK